MIGHTPVQRIRRRVRACIAVAFIAVVPAQGARAYEGLDPGNWNAVLPPAVDTADRGHGADGIRALRSRLGNFFSQQIEQAAALHRIPLDFFAALIWQESRFNPRAISPAGAQGIAQFMPGTARWRGLSDPFEPAQALLESARWLRELRAEFGNLGLAAAAYNAGPERVRKWLTGGGFLPAETRAYVQIITGRTADDWARCPAQDGSGEAAGCHDVPKFLVRAAAPKAIERENWGPWGLQLIGDWSETRALAEYQKLQQRFPAILGDRKPLVLRGRMAGRGSAAFYRIRVAEGSRDGANSLCARLERAGGKCLVFRN